ncbi:MAG TPA: hypothetical protein V6D11_26835 [Waterburya sp.]|jgi:hypothetical protein
MRRYNLLVGLTFLTILLAVDSQPIGYGTTAHLEPATSSQRVALAAKTKIGPNPSPDRGSSRRRFNQLQKIVFPQLL